MGKTKRLKKLMEAEAGLLHEKLNKLIGELAEVKRQAAKNAHPSTMSPEARAWCDLVDRTNAAFAASNRVEQRELKPEARLVLFKRVKGDLYGQRFLATKEQFKALSDLGVGYSMESARSATNPKDFVGQFNKFRYRGDLSVLTRTVNEIFNGRFTFYAEVENIA